ncbi:DUF87 domain-containing protein [Bdellovibrionota bacterium FG-2]
MPLPGLLLLTASVISIEILTQGALLGSLISMSFAVGGYVLLRCLARFAKPGWEEKLLFPLEQIMNRMKRAIVHLEPECLEVLPPDTLDLLDLERLRKEVCSRIEELKPEETWSVQGSWNPAKGFHLSRVITKNFGQIEGELTVLLHRKAHSLYQLPVHTDPLWLFGTLKKLSGPYEILVSICGQNQNALKRQVENARQRSFHTQGLSNVDSDITFEESTQVLQGLSRGDESLVEMQLAIFTDEEAKLDPHYFVRESSPLLVLASLVGTRPRGFRTHVVRAVTAADLIPRFQDPRAEEIAPLRSVRNVPLAFDAQDARLEALHWLVTGATGSGKSFFVGLMLQRMIEAKTPMSVLFLDHNRSFRRLVHSQGGVYLEPKKLSELILTPIFERLEYAGAMTGLELSDLSLTDKKEAARKVLHGIEHFLRNRRSIHPVYVVFDECWNFLRDEPVLVQRAFREFRKLNGAAIAITQSLTDFLRDESGSSVFQNAPIRILLRQGEDLTPYRGLLCLNDLELSTVRTLRKENGRFSECLIKTPYFSRIARLYPAETEHQLLRTDNLRAEYVAQKQKERA